MQYEKFAHNDSKLINTCMRNIILHGKHHALIFQVWTCKYVYVLCDGQCKVVWNNSFISSDAKPAYPDGRTNLVLTFSSILALELPMPPHRVFFIPHTTSNELWQVTTDSEKPCLYLLLTWAKTLSSIRMRRNDSSSQRPRHESCSPLCPFPF